MDLCIYDNILDKIQITVKKLLHFKLSKSDQILCVDKTCFPRPSHKWSLSGVVKELATNDNHSRILHDN